MLTPKRLRELAAANVAVDSEATLEDVLQKTADVAARLVNARYATGSHSLRDLHGPARLTAQQG